MLFWMLDVPESTLWTFPANIPRQGHFQIFPGLMVKLGETEMQAPCSGDQALGHGSPQALIPAVTVGFQSGLGVVEPWNLVQKAGQRLVCWFRNVHISHKKTTTA